MPWLDKPAGVYIRMEVVFHRLDEPLIKREQTAANIVTVWEIWGARVIYSFDAAAGKWSVSMVEQQGCRRGAKSSQWISVPGRHPEIVELAEKYQPDWIPEPSQPRTMLPAEDVFDEAISAAVQRVPDAAASLWRVENPYRGE